MSGVKEKNGVLSKLKPLVPAFYFAVLSIAVWGKALFGYGFVLMGDMVFTPAMYPAGSLLGPPRGLLSVSAVFNLIHLLSQAFSGMLVQKVILFLMVFLTGILMYYSVPCKTEWGRFLAGTLYAFNPFIYVRLLMGHWGFVLGYSLIPVVIKSARRLTDEPCLRNAAIYGLWLSLASILSAHCGVIALIVTLLMFMFSLCSKEKRRRRALFFAASLLIFVLLSSFWIIPAFQSEGLESAIGNEDLEAFETRSTSSAGTAVSVLGMYGYWRIRLDPLLPRSNLPLWPAFIVVFAALSIIGLAGNWKNSETGTLVKVLLVTFLLGFFLALGSRAPLTGGIYSFLFEHFAVIKLFREPQKFAAMIALSYSMLGALGFERLLLAVKGKNKNIEFVRIAAFVIMILLIFTYSYRMFGGLWGEARPVTYPESWSEAQALLDEDEDDFEVLYLPPYWYMQFDFQGSDRTIASPLPLYFRQSGIPFFRIDVGRFKLNEQNTDRYVRSALESAEQNSNLGALLAPLNVKYIVFARSDGSEYLEYVLDQGDLEVVKEWPDMVLLKNRVDVARLSLATSEGTYGSWEEVGNIAEESSLLGAYLETSNDTDIPGNPGIPLDTKTGPDLKTEFTFPETTGREAGLPEKAWLLLGEPFDSRWRLNGVSGTPQLGLTCAYPVDPSDRETQVIEYENSWLIAGYVISIIALLITVALVVPVNWNFMHRNAEEQQDREIKG